LSVAEIYAEMQAKLADVVPDFELRCPHTNEITMEDTLNALR
jgi:hypothetical protein